VKVLKELFDKNSEWSEKIKNEDPDFFTKLSKQQNPKYLWIGCADSRVPANQIVGLLPGELFVHRNVANVVVHTDLNCLSVMQFAVDVLKIEHIIVCGHYSCGGVKAALRGERHGLVDNWLRHVQDVNLKHYEKLTEINEEHKRVDKLCELNVVEQVINVCQTTVLQDAWERDHKISVHGWIYSLSNGLLKDLNMCISKPDEISESYGTALQNLFN
jgi:carbonic anhydrase